MQAHAIDNTRKELEAERESKQRLEEHRQELEKEITALKAKHASTKESLQGQSRLYENLAHEMKVCALQALACC